MTRLDRCVVKRCRGLPELSVMGVMLCDRHWTMYCDDEVHRNQIQDWVEAQNKPEM